MYSCKITVMQNAIQEHEIEKKIFMKNVISIDSRVVTGE
jgi:hypothetical protein